MTREEIMQMVIDSGTSLQENHQYMFQVLENIQMVLGNRLESVKEIPISQLDLYAAAANAFVTVSDKLTELLQGDVDLFNHVMRDDLTATQFPVNGQTGKS